VLGLIPYARFLLQGLESFGCPCFWRVLDVPAFVTCTHVQPVTVDINDGRAFARLIYEQTNNYADGRITTKAWHMVVVFRKYRKTWQVLETNMVDTTPTPDAESDNSGAPSYKLKCPAA
jgi:hypothetical protein